MRRRWRLAARAGVLLLVAFGMLAAGASMAGGSPGRPAEDPPANPTEQLCFTFVTGERVYWYGEDLPNPIPYDDATSWFGTLQPPTLYDPSLVPDSDFPIRDGVPQPPLHPLAKVRMKTFIKFASPMSFRSHNGETVSINANAVDGLSDQQLAEALAYMFGNDQYGNDGLSPREIFGRIQANFVCQNRPEGDLFETDFTKVYDIPTDPNQPCPDIDPNCGNDDPDDPNDPGNPGDPGNPDDPDNPDGGPPEGQCIAIRRQPGRTIPGGGDWPDDIPRQLPIDTDLSQYGLIVPRADFRINQPDDVILFCRVGDVWERKLWDPHAVCTRPSLIPESCMGAFPTSHYQLGYDGGGLFDGKFWNPVRRSIAIVTDMSFALSRTAVQATLWVLEEVFTYPFERWESFATNIGESYRTNLLLPIPFEDAAWLVLISWCGVAALRGRMGMAGGELVMSIIMIGLATVVVTQREHYMGEALQTMDGISTSVIAAGSRNQVPEIDPDLNGNGKVTPAELDATREQRYRTVIEPVGARLHDVFVEESYDYLNWGENLGKDEDGNPLRACAASRDVILAMADDEALDDDEERLELMEDTEGCGAPADAFRDPTTDRMMGAVVNLILSVIVLFIVGLVALTLITAKYITAVLFIMAPFAAMAAILPVQGRRLAYLWVATLAQMFLSVIFTGLLLSFIMLGMEEVLRLTEDRPLWERWMVLLVIFLTVYVTRETLLNSSRTLAGSLANALTRLTPAGAQHAREHGQPSQAGFDFLKYQQRGTRAAGYAAWAGFHYGVRPAVGVALAPAKAAGRSYVKRADERRVQYRGRRNLMDQAISNRNFERPGILLAGGNGPQSHRPGRLGGGGGDGGGGDRARYYVNAPGGDVQRGFMPPHRSWPSRVIHPIRTHRENVQARDILEREWHIPKPSLKDHIFHPGRVRSDLRSYSAGVRRRQRDQDRRMGAARRIARNHGEPTPRFYDDFGRRM